MVPHPPPIAMIHAPLFLRKLKIWLCWKSLPNADKKKKNIKFPYYANGTPRGAHGTPEDIDQLVSFEEAKEAAIKHGSAGIGIALLKGYALSALDFDNCIEHDSILPEIDTMLSGTYTEYSPSRKGVRAFVLGDLGNKKSPTTATQFGFELFNTKGFVTFTGNTTELCQLTGSENAVLPIEQLSPNLITLIQQRFQRDSLTPALRNEDSHALGLTTELLTEILDFIPPDCDYGNWVMVGMGLHHELQGSEAGFELWDTWSSHSSDKYTSTESNQTKWVSFGENTPANHITGRSIIKLAGEYGYMHGPLVEALDSDFTPLDEPLPPDKDKPDETTFFHIRTDQEFVARGNKTEWLIKGFLPKADIGVIYGESGSGKSFVALDICAALTRGDNWNGLRCARSPRRILYVVAEGSGGFANRISAFLSSKASEIHDYPSSLGIDIISDVSPNLINAESVRHLISDIGKRGPYDLIVMDTFAQMTPGANENSGQEMGRALAYCGKIAKVAKGMVLLVHHIGKDASKGMRGWSGVNAAADVAIEVTRIANDRIVKTTKQKDGVEGLAFGFQLNQVVLYQDEDGDDVSSCVVQYTGKVDLESQNSEENTRILPKNQRMIVSVFDVLAIDNQDGLDIRVSKEALIERCKNELGHITRENNKRKVVTQAIERLVEMGLFEEIDGFIYDNR